MPHIGSNSVYANIAVKKGDLLGFYFPGASIIPFKGHECTTPTTYYEKNSDVQGDKNFLPRSIKDVKGKTFEFKKKQNGWKPCRTYSQLAVIIPSK